MTVMRFLTLSAGISLALLPLLAQTAKTPGNRIVHTQHPRPSQKDASAQGQRVFQQNCARCHDAPQAFPPQISGTVLRHMRVRASLSAADEDALLRFLNP